MVMKPAAPCRCKYERHVHLDGKGVAGGLLTCQVHAPKCAATDGLYHLLGKHGCCGELGILKSGRGAEIGEPATQAATP